MFGSKQYCYPLTITDYRARYLLACDVLSSTRSAFAFTVFERAFKDFGLPEAIRTDNGVPFASGNALFGLSRLALWWLRLAIKIQRIKPAAFDFLQPPAAAPGARRRLSRRYLYTSVRVTTRRQTPSTRITIAPSA